ncbi:MAG: class I SAM-dependent methyltransferase [Chloroflexota bacterium]|nr:MAG: class I SAM-dependent methyltransferase [Chloroflexota bacterium]
MSNYTDTIFVKTQYGTSANLDARIALHQNFSTASEHFHDWLFDHVHLPHNARVLEIGCGSGALWERVRGKIPNTWNIILSDFSLGMARTVQEKFLASRFSFLASDAQSLPFPNESFDGIFANHMLYHIPDMHRALAEIRHVLKRGGTLYAATNGMGHMRELTELTTTVSGVTFTEQTPERLFGLENGAAILEHHFAHVTRDVQANDLRVTEIEPLIAYVNSGLMYKAATRTAQSEQAFRRHVQHAIDTQGAFHITKAVGLFMAG